MYKVVLFLHLLGVAMLVMALSYSLGGFFKARMAHTVQDVRTALSFVPITERMIGPAMLVLLASGLYMVGDLHWGWGTGWIDVAIAIFVLMAGLGTQVEGKRIEAIREKAGELPDGPVPAELDAMRRDPVLTHVAFFGASQVIAFLFLMTNKPSLGGAIAAVVVAAVISVAPARMLLKPTQQAEPAPEVQSVVA